MAKRGAWRLDGGARRVETIAPSLPPPIILGRRPHRLAMRRRARGRASPVGNAKTHSTPSHDDGVEHKWWLPSPPPPPLPPPWASRRRPRHHTRRRLRRATRCVGAFASAAPAQHARALRAIDPCCAGTSWPDLGVRAQLLRSARASRRAAKGAGRSMANGEMVGSGAVLRRAWNRPQRGGGAHRASAKKGRTEQDELKGDRASTLKGCCARLFQGPQD